MDEGRNAKAQLICSLCSKVFEKHSTLKRHGYYCRSRPVGQRITRGGSCKSCAQAKTRCDSKIPQCSRCKTKKLDCRYQSRVTGNSSQVTLSSSRADSIVDGAAVDVNEEDILSMSARSNQYGPLPGNGDDIRFDQYMLDDECNMELSICEQAESDWSVPPISVASDMHMGLEFDSSLLWTSDSGMFMAQYPTTSFECLPPFLCCPTNVSTVPRSIDPSLSPRAFRPRMSIRTDSRRSAILLRSILGSYPRMMLQKDMLPPFIYSLCYPHDKGEEIRVLQPLTNCVSLVEIYVTGRAASRKVFWEAVRLECQWLVEQHKNFDKWNTLSAVQALLVYVLIRLFEGESENNKNIDVALIASIQTITTSLASKIRGVARLEDIYHIHEMTWKEWIFEESRRRTATVFRTLQLIVNIDPVILCGIMPGFVFAPLPARKSFWEAHNAEIWTSEVRSRINTDDNFGLMTNGDLVKLREEFIGLGPDHSAIQSNNGKNWEEWSAGMDGIGALVMIGASLL